MKKSKTLEQMRSTQKVLKTSVEALETYGLEDSQELVKSILEYEGGIYIIDKKDGNYEMLVDRTYYETTDLYQLEQILWDDFLKDENGVSDEKYEDDLHDRAFELLCDIDEDCSLDEVDLSKHSEDDVYKIKYLLRQFNNL